MGQKVESIGDKITTLYEQLYHRKKINKRLISELQDEIIDTSSKILSYRHASFFGDTQKSTLEKRIDLLEKTKRTELVDYWRDLLKINIYLFQAKEEYSSLLNKKELIQ